MRDKHKCMLWIFVISGLLIASNAQSQPRQQDLFPETGAWFEPDNPGTGFFMEVQNGILAGAFFGYENDGGNAWLLFNGELTAGSGRVEWVLDAALTQSADGECIIGCVDPSNNSDRQVSDVGNIQIQFSQRDLATYRVNGQEPREIRPLQFGVAGSAPFGIAPGVSIPDLSGKWLLRVTISGRAGLLESGMSVSIGDAVTGSGGADGTTSITYPVSRSTISADAMLTGPNDVAAQSDVPVDLIGEVFCANGGCVLDVCQFFTPDRCSGGFEGNVNRFFVNELTDHRFFARTTIGFDPPTAVGGIEGFRLDYD